ncbi:MAG: hypothetical protein ABSD70_09135 [Terracidiphilus sp.]
MSEPAHPTVALTVPDPDRILRRAMVKTLILGFGSSAVVLIGSNWRNAAMLATGTLISAASIWEWQRLVRVLNAKLDKQKAPVSTPIVVLFLVLRLTVFAGVIYGSLRCFRGSIMALFFGVGLAALTIVWESLSLLRD